MFWNGAPMRAASMDSDVSRPKSPFPLPSLVAHASCARGGGDDVRATLTAGAQYPTAGELQYRRIVLDNNVFKTLVKVR